MNKLDKLLSRSIYFAQDTEKLYFSVDDVKAQIIALIQEVIGKDEDAIIDDLFPIPEKAERNNLRAEQRKRLAELTGEKQ
jgi:hypothetical protein